MRGLGPKPRTHLRQVLPIRFVLSVFSLRLGDFVAWLQGESGLPPHRYHACFHEYDHHDLCCDYFPTALMTF